MLAKAETTTPALSSPSDPQGEATSAMNTEPTSGETTTLEPETTVANRRRGLWGWLLPSRRLLSDATEDQSTTSSTAPAEDITAPAEDTTAPAEDTTAPAEDTTALAEGQSTTTTTAADRATTTTTAADRATTSSTVLPEDQVEGQPSTTTTAEDQTALDGDTTTMAQSETTALDASEITALDASETTTTALPEDQAVGQTTAPAWSRFEGVCPGIRRPRRYAPRLLHILAFV